MRMLSVALSCVAGSQIRLAQTVAELQAATQRSRHNVKEFSATASGRARAEAEQRGLERDEALLHLLDIIQEAPELHIMEDVWRACVQSPKVRALALALGSIVDKAREVLRRGHSSDQNTHIVRDARLGL